MSAALVPAAATLGERPRYELMREAVALCATVDEASEMRDRAAALSFYARQRDDTELRRWLEEIRLRAGRRIGELLRDIERERGGRPSADSRLLREPSLVARAIEGAGLRRGPAYELQEIAGPADARLRAVADEAAEGYFARARADAEVPTQVGLKRAVVTAVHAALSPEEIGRLHKTFGRDRQARKAVLRAEKEVRLGARSRAAAACLGAARYAVLYADPPWRFAVRSEGGMDRAAENHYPTLPTAEICALSVPAAPDCALFLWATAPMLEDALAVMRAWDFGYRTHYVWRKPKLGLGYWNRSRHELLLFGVRGTVPAPTPGTQPESVFEAAQGRHSEKPDLAAEMIAGLFPTAPRCELFARAPRRGWAAWGNEVEAAA